MIAASRLAAAGAGIAAGLLVVLAVVEGGSGALTASTTTTTVVTASSSDAPESALSTSTTTTTTTPSTTTAPSTGLFDPSEQKPLTVSLRCLGIDVDGVAIFSSIGGPDEVARRRLTEIAVAAGAAGGFVIDPQLLAKEFADVRLDTERCSEAKIERELVDEPERWPCVLAADLVLAGGSVVDEVIDRFEIDCDAHLSERIGRPTRVYPTS